MAELSSKKREARLQNMRSIAVVGHEGRIRRAAVDDPCGAIAVRASLDEPFQDGRRALVHDQRCCLILELHDHIVQRVGVSMSGCVRHRSIVVQLNTSCCCLFPV